MDDLFAAMASTLKQKRCHAEFKLETSLENAANLLMAVGSYESVRLISATLFDVVFKIESCLSVNVFIFHTTSLHLSKFPTQNHSTARPRPHDTKVSRTSEGPPKVAQEANKSALTPRSH